VQVRPTEVDDPVAGGVGDVGPAEAPLARDRPVEDLGAGRHLVDLDVDVLAEAVERLADPLPGDAAADREDLRRQLVDLRPDPVTGALLGDRPGLIHFYPRCSECEKLGERWDQYCLESAIGRITEPARPFRAGHQ
jgi:hypothetical protein